MEQEEWKSVVDYEGLYECSDMGRVKSLNYRRTGKEEFLKPAPDDGGYLQINLCKNGEQETRRVHVIVMRAFKGKCPDGCEVDHINFKQDDNRLENLRYLPAKENASRHSPEWQKKNAEAMKKLAQDPEWLKKNAEQREKMYQDPEWKKVHAGTMKRLSQNQEWRKNQAEAVRKANSKPIDQFTLDGQFVKRWSSAREIERELGIRNSHISLCCNGKRKKTGGFIWRFAD